MVAIDAIQKLCMVVDDTQNKPLENDEKIMDTTKIKTKI